MLRHVGNLDADCSQADDSQLFILYFRSCKILFHLFSSLGDVRIVFIFFHPVNSADDVAGGQEHGGNDDFLHTVCIGARRVEYNNTFSGAFIQRDVVHSGACPCHGKKIGRQRHIVHIGASYEDAVGFLNIICFYIVLGKTLQPHLCDGIQAMIFKHSGTPFLFT